MIKILYHFRKKSMAIYAEAKAPLHKMPLKFSVTDYSWPGISLWVSYSPFPGSYWDFRLLLGILVEV